MKFKSLIVILTLLLVATLTNADQIKFKHIFDAFNTINEYHRDKYTTADEEDKKTLNRLLNLPYQSIGFSGDIDNVVSLYQNDLSRNYSSENNEIAPAIIAYLNKRFIKEELGRDIKILYAGMKDASIEKVNPNQCGLFGNEYYVELEITVLYEDKENNKIEHTFRKQIKEMVENE